TDLGCIKAEFPNTAYTNAQLVEAEKEFTSSNRYLCRANCRIELASSLNLTERQSKFGSKIGKVQSTLHSISGIPVQTEQLPHPKQHPQHHQHQQMLQAAVWHWIPTAEGASQQRPQQLQPPTVDETTSAAAAQRQQRRGGGSGGVRIRRHTGGTGCQLRLVLQRRKMNNLADAGAVARATRDAGELLSLIHAGCSIIACGLDDCCCCRPLLGTALAQGAQQELQLVGAGVVKSGQAAVHLPVLGSGVRAGCSGGMPHLPSAGLQQPQRPPGAWPGPRERPARTVAGQTDPPRRWPRTAVTR
uniref:Homeobox domain-containing protein n=1 Tax=Macrostomum lignano TaxID=282301 RepID=A0A1I8JS46_9PLAT